MLGGEVVARLAKVVVRGWPMGLYAFMLYFDCTRSCVRRTKLRYDAQY